MGSENDEDIQAASCTAAASGLFLGSLVSPLLSGLPPPCFYYVSLNTKPDKRLILLRPLDFAKKWKHLGSWGVRVVAGALGHKRGFCLKLKQTPASANVRRCLSM